MEKKSYGGEFLVEGTLANSCRKNKLDFLMHQLRDPRLHKGREHLYGIVYTCGHVGQPTLDVHSEHQEHNGASSHSHVVLQPPVGKQDRLLMNFSELRREVEILFHDQLSS